MTSFIKKTRTIALNALGTTSLLVLSGTIATIVVFAEPAAAADEYNVSSGVTSAGAPLGMHGMDTVALASGGAAQQGMSTYTAVHDGVSYYFASAETKAEFEANPDAYLPQFGGFCALAVGLGKKFDGDPRFADIRNGKLYVFVDEPTFGAYLNDKDGTLARSEAAWPKIHHTPVSEL